MLAHHAMRKNYVCKSIYMDLEANSRCLREMNHII